MEVKKKTYYIEGYQPSEIFMIVLMDVLLERMCIQLEKYQIVSKLKMVVFIIVKRIMQRI